MSAIHAPRHEPENINEVTHQGIGRPCIRLLGEFLEIAECSPYAIPKTMHAIIAAMLIAPILSAIVTGGLGIMVHFDRRPISSRARSEAGDRQANVTIHLDATLWFVCHGP